MATFPGFSGIALFALQLVRPLCCINSIRPPRRLISTDAAARGIDINYVKCVVNYDAPQYIRTYIHRSAASADSSFKLSLLFPSENNFLRMVMEAGSPGIQKQMVKPESLKGMEERYQVVLQELADVIKVDGVTDEKSRH
ncbi:hypothetical protein CCH79_00016059 [Gambusia affinis]|uniref:ATP-dependent RNA helicase n=1 Tax=Gambusia affinis TaxID=33528 RepID=A0A315VB48_GAMAF|nr:hypothetical protein CCH79_00016059 [Gambusia affinis]